jgi:NADH-ubiquinone oxidoreductase chain 4
VKLPVYGVHLWLPKAHVEAPVSGSMVLAGALLKLGGYGFYRFSFFVVQHLNLLFTYFYSIGLIGGLVSCFLCLRQSDLKAFVAYSSICHMGYALAALYRFTFIGLEGSVYIFVRHGFCSSCMFYILYLFYERYHTRSSLMVKGCTYLLSYMLFFLFLFSVLNMGLPPSLSFFSEVSISISLINLDLFSFIPGGMLLFFSGLYRIYFYVVISHGHPIFKGLNITFRAREISNIYSHLSPLFFVSLYIPLFFVI